MTMLPGTPALDGIDARQLLGRLQRLVRDMPRQTAAAHLALHRLDPTSLVETFGDRATVDRRLSSVAVSTDDDRSHPLRPGVEWLTDNLPAPRSALVLCHGDSWGETC